MKAEDLMIGDWVVGCSGEPFKIGIIDPDFLHWNELQPIPLTVEILEKNGILRDEGGEIFAEYFEEDDKGLLEISVDSESIWWTIEYLENRVLRFNYVHELQHALKLCRIEKEIEL